MSHVVVSPSTTSPGDKSWADPGNAIDGNSSTFASATGVTAPGRWDFLEIPAGIVDDGVQTGTATFTQSGLDVVGVGTLFTSEYSVGAYIRNSADDDNQFTRIASITDNLNLVLDTLGYRGASASGVTIHAGTRTVATDDAGSDQQYWGIVEVDWEIVGSTGSGGDNPYLSINMMIEPITETYFEVVRFEGPSGAGPQARKTDTVLIPAGSFLGLPFRRIAGAAHKLRMDIVKTSGRTIVGRIYEVTLTLIARSTQANVEG